MIRIDDVTYFYSKSSRPALDSISACIPEGIHLLVGENGAGKTTLLYAIAGLLTPQEGTITVDGQEATDMRPSHRSEMFLFNEDIEVTEPTIAKFAKVYSGFFPGFSQKRFEENLALFGQTGDEKIRKLSMGNRKKAILSLVLALGVKTLLLDEPTNGLDIQSKDILRKILVGQMSDGQTIVISTHNVAEFRNLYEGMMVVGRGKLLAAATSDMIMDTLEFSLSPRKDPDALYAELCLGGYNSIFAASGEGSDSEIDWELLYKAIMSPNGSEITKILNGNNLHNNESGIE